MSDFTGILYEEVELAESAGKCFSSEPDGTWKRHMYMAATSGDWVEASKYDKTHPNWVCTPLSGGGDTALHVAVSMEQFTFVSKLLERMSLLDLEIRNAYGNTAFCMAAISGNVKIATILFNKNPTLVWIRGHKDMLPIQLASSAGHSHMVQFLFEKPPQDMHFNLPFQDIVMLFFFTITNNIYSVALNLLDRYPKLATTGNEEGLTALQVLAKIRKPAFDEDAPGYRDIISCLCKGIKEEFLNSVRTSEAMFDAAKSGNATILEYILKYNPNLMMKVDSRGQSLLHIAILYRHISVYRVIMSKGAYKNIILQLVDYDGNNVLHLAGMLSAEERFGSSVCPVLICSEEMWFKEVERIVPPALRSMENKDGRTPKELFYREHKELAEKAISELNGIASNYLVVGTLIMTLGVTGDLTIRTNNIEGRTPYFSVSEWYIIFAISIALGSGFCLISMFLFTSVLLASTWKTKQCYVRSLLIRVACGYLMLSLSVGTMLTVSAVSGAVLIYSFFPEWVLIVCAALTVIPLILSPLIYNYALHLAAHLTLRVCEEAAIRILSTMGIKWDPIYFLM
ncbi:uncharacterized protein LOC133284470 [Gastrolobium bilobum]|uniref:uncharacterized protein LOC133284470 n=1 Tax=Gastrolobium bilobum TaxID=150636 RepID=UPI002AB2A34C|nr:uncharacterized protein LOC133284470 [Gastrolobium bilobum]